MTPTSAVTPAQFRELTLLPAYRPVVLRGFAADWPAVAAGRNGPTRSPTYLKAHDAGAPVQAFVGPPEIGGKFFYAPQGRAVNFARREAADVAGGRRDPGHAGRPTPSIYVGSTPAPQALPGFAEANPNRCWGPSVDPRVWIGGETVVATHYDLSDNIAVCVAGRRRFTLIPPEQTKNLYVGPLDFTPAGQPVSMVDLEAPGPGRYPNFADAVDGDKSPSWSRRRDLHPGPVVAPRALDRAAERAGELLVERPGGRGRLAVRGADPRPDVGAPSARAATRGLAGGVRALCVRG
jgi:hypothetical protein